LGEDEKLPADGSLVRRCFSGGMAEESFFNAGLVFSRIGCGISSVVANLGWL